MAPQHNTSEAETDALHIDTHASERTGQETEQWSAGAVSGKTSEADSPTSEISDDDTRAVYVVYKTWLVHVGRDAEIEPPAVRSKIMGVFLDLERARQVAKRTWNSTFGFSIPERRVDETDMCYLSPLFGDEWVGEVWKCTNKAYVDKEDGTEYKGGEKVVRVCRVKIDAHEAVEEGEGSDCRSEST